MTLTASVLIGIITGVIASFLMSLATIFWKEVVVPKIHAMRYSGLLVGGKWHSKPEGFCQEITLELEQNADQLNGVAIFVSDDGSNTDHEKVRNFSINGYIKDGMIALHSLSGKQNRLGIHTFLVKASGDGRELIGMMTYYAVRGKSKNKISSTVINFIHESCNEVPENPVL